MKLSDMQRTENQIKLRLAVRIDGAKEVENYVCPSFTPSGKLCDWGFHVGAKPDTGYWIDPARIEVVEIVGKVR